MRVLRYTTRADCTLDWHWITVARYVAPEHIVAGLAACSRAAALAGALGVAAFGPPAPLPDAHGGAVPVRMATGTLPSAGGPGAFNSSSARPFFAPASPAYGDGWLQSLGAVPFVLPGGALVPPSAVIDVPEPASLVLLLPAVVAVVWRRAGVGLRRAKGRICT